MKELLAGSDLMVPLAGGGQRRFANMDHAASTPPFLAVLDAVTRSAPTYANVHRGRGWTSQITTDAFEEAREDVRRFAGADHSQVVIFTRNTTESLNHVAARLPVPAGGVVISTLMEHHSNDLPWRRIAPVLRAGIDAAGRVDEQQLLDLLTAHRGRVVALAVSAASNVTGLVNPVHRWAEWAHAAGAPIVVDAAQLAPHRPLDVRAAGDSDHLDYVAFSAHKMYAPFGVGVLIGPRSTFEQGAPWQSGGGTVAIVEVDDVVWATAPDREEAGTPCVMGVLALAEAIRALKRIGWSTIQEHEDQLSAAAIEGLKRLPGVTLYGADDSNRLGVLAFTVDAVPHAKVAAILADEWGISTRSGCFCAHPYVKELLGVTGDAAREVTRLIASGDHGDAPGMVRASLGLASVRDDIDRLGEALAAITRGRFGDYALDRASGEYHHARVLTTA